MSAEYESWKAKGLKLNMARGKPSKQQLDLVSGILTALTSAEECVDSGVDARNYGELKGLESARKLFADTTPKPESASSKTCWVRRRRNARRSSVPQWRLAEESMSAALMSTR